MKMINKLGLLLVLRITHACPYATSVPSEGEAPLLFHARDDPEWSPFYTNNMTEAAWEALRFDVYNTIVQGGHAPAVVQLAWLDASSTGGPHAELRLGDNSTTIQLLESIKKKHAGITHADLWSYAAAVAVSNSGGPTINWRPGRNDALIRTPDHVSLQPNPTADPASIRGAFSSIGMDDKETVALMGAHCMGTHSLQLFRISSVIFTPKESTGNAHLNVSGYVGSWTQTPLFVTNQYFTQLTKNSTYRQETITSLDNTTRMQYSDNSGRFMLPSDMALTQDRIYLSHVQNYASNLTAFLSDFNLAFSKLLEVGVASGLSNVSISTSITDFPAADQVQPTALDPEMQCYPSYESPRFCMSAQDTGSNLVYTIHSAAIGWTGFGVGSTSMKDGDVIAAWRNSSGQAWTTAFSTSQHAIQVAKNSAWKQVVLMEPAPAWSKISFSAIHPKIVASSGTGKTGNDITGEYMFAISSVVPAGDLDRLNGVSVLYQHDVSGVLGNIRPKPFTGPRRANASATDIASSETGGPAPPSGSFARLIGIAFGSVALVVLVLTGVGLMYFRKRIVKSDTNQPMTEMPTFLEPSQAGLDENGVARERTSRKGRRRALGSSVSASSSFSDLGMSETSSVQLNGQASNMTQEFLNMRPISSSFLQSSAASPSPLTLANLNALDTETRDSDLFRALAIAQISASDTYSQQTQRTSLLVKRKEVRISEDVVQRSNESLHARVFALAATNGLDAKEPTLWGMEEVACWVLKNGGNSIRDSGVDVVSVVQVGRMTGPVLLASPVDDLLELFGIFAYGDRVLFAEAFDKLKK
ncbi:hypothetical protein CcCBS67573_g09745 [Chytriomyces confervae]|uniref:Peroxidase n=1 Tax=Chytriomyces confervae TaxID=246404 RepID=A0A507DQI4_9FUNG|nr:hypothetical protein CcCBS67573_g09745 [Chytriomyces confervae]